MKAGHWKACLLRNTVLVSMLGAMTAVPALSQEDDVVRTQTAGDDTATMDTVLVTGSRIARDSNLVASGPVQSVTSDDILNSGNFNIAEVINDLPALLASTTSEQTTQTATTLGTNVLNLRGMGSSRTLVLVNGRRHVSGVEGTQAVDVGSIPSALIESVEVLTGGASAVYGADAVTGVVNFILKDDYEGTEFDFTKGLSSEGDAGQLRGFVVHGKNFADGRGNVTFSAEYTKDEGLRKGDRPFTAGYATAADWANPALRFQEGDIGSSTPNFAQFYNFDNTGLYPRGLSIPSAANFVSAYTAAFGSAPTLTSAEQALIDRAAGAFPRVIGRFPTFSITSAGGIVVPADFSLAPGVDVDGNGIDDCLDSFVGYNSSFDGAASFGLLGGCWNVLGGGQVVPVQDGLIAGDFNHFGGSGIIPDDLQHIIAPEDKVALNLNGKYEALPGVTFYGEAKYVVQNVRQQSPYNTYWDLIYIDPANPFIPESLQGVADNSGGLFITRDHTDLGENIDKVRRETQRYVAGVTAEFNDDWVLDISANYGQFELRTRDGNRPYIDRLLAATDVRTDVNGNPICASELGILDYPTAPFDIPPWDGGFYTFTPGAGECVPLNPFGVGSISQEAVDWVTTTTETRQKITQRVLAVNLVGDSSDWISLQGGPIGFALGAEFRAEKSLATYDPLALGIIPIDAIDADGNPVPAGSNLSDVSGQNSLVWDPAAQLANSTGSFDAFDYYAEVSAPVLSELPGAYNLTIDAAARMAQYSTIGDALTWKVGATYAPFQGLSFRVTQSEAIRAPNITELFSPDQGATFRPIDPCSAEQIPTAPDPGLRAANCAALGLPATYVDPLSARFFGVRGGNPDLQEETATTFSAGFVLQPTFIPGFSLTVDYWDIDIENAISTVSAQDIVDLCVDSSSINNEYCPLIGRVSNPASPQFGGFNFLRQSSVNFGRLEAAGVDFQALYRFDLGQNTFSIGVGGTIQDKLDRYFDPADPTKVDPELGELFYPKEAGTAFIGYDRGGLSLKWTTNYQGEQLLAGAEIEDYLDIFGPSVMMDPVYVHNVSGSYRMDNGISLRAGVNNVTNEEPFITEFSWPTGARGRYFYVGTNIRF